MNDTTTTSAEQAIKDELRRLGWMIPDAQRRLNEHAQTMLRRAERAVKDMEAMMANQPCSMSVCARPTTPWRDDCRGDRDGAMGVLDDELEAQVTRSF